MSEPSRYLEFSGRRFEVVRASDVIRGGMVLQVDEVGSRTNPALEAFRRDSDGRLTFSAYSSDLPFDLVEVFVGQVREALTPNESEP